MPKSKRAKVVSLTKTEKKGRAKKEELVQEIQENLDKWKYLWIFEVGQMRNTYLKDIRADWKGTGRLFFGRVSVMALALGTSSEREHLPGLSKLSSHLKGQVGLFFTSWDIQETLDYFHSISKPDFARSGSIATQTFVVQSGPLCPVLSKVDEEAGMKQTPFPSSMEPLLRKLGLSTRLERGVVTLSTEQTVCEKGKQLTTEQAHLLKLFGVRTSVFRVSLRYLWDKETGDVKEQDPPIEDAEPAGDSSSEEDDEEMED
ncbi:mRNA turnover and ribosome assembly protein [Serendipita sp. 397]|nr:mRNA turnover and ribosome assembly protein [Serendipita sp. 397]KAG8810801.1 mRNA turnover and ribosome assembly protein [Serendipita sp. 400]